MMIKVKYGWPLLLCFLSSCHSLEADKEEAAALLDKPTQETRKALETAMGNLLGSQPIKIADNAFTTKNTLRVEKAPSTDSRGNLLDGRLLGPVESFSLLKKDGVCWLEHHPSNQQLPLKNISCKVE